MSIEKKFLKSKPECKVTFCINLKEAQSVEVAGAFNNWKPEELPLKKSKNGTFKGSIKLPIDKSYEFKYLVDKQSWMNDDAADKYVWNNFAGSDNSVLEL